MQLTNVIKIHFTSAKLYIAIIQEEITPYQHRKSAGLKTKGNILLNQKMLRSKYNLSSVTLLSWILNGSVSCFYSIGKFSTAIILRESPL